MADDAPADPISAGRFHLPLEIVERAGRAEFVEEAAAAFGLFPRDVEAERLEQQFER